VTGMGRDLIGRPPASTTAWPAVRHPSLDPDLGSVLRPTGASSAPLIPEHPSQGTVTALLADDPSPERVDRLPNVVVPL
jgi:hypothetical protein